MDYFDIPENLDLELKKRYNTSQYIAIKESLKKEGITLVQGPPGTGKTTTILGVLSVLLSSKNKKSQYSIIPELKIEKSNEESNQLQKKKLWSKAMPWLSDDYEDW
jgi:senataxin